MNVSFFYQFNASLQNKNRNKKYILLTLKHLNASVYKTGSDLIVHN